MTQSHEVGGRELCPCDSGGTYARCCKKRKFKWMRDARGNISKVVPLSSEAIALLKDANQKFREIFGRKPRRNDHVFSQKYYVSRRDLDRESLRAMKSVGANPAVIYATRKTGFIVTQNNRKLLSTEEECEWDDAIDEYFEEIEAGANPDALISNDGPPEFLRDHIRRNQIVGGYFIDHHFNAYRHRPGSCRSVEMVAAFATTNFTRSLKSIHILLENDVSFDVNYLLRALYENYLTLKFVYSCPERVDAILAQLGTLAGTHVLAKGKAGLPIQSQIIEISTGRKIIVPSRWTMASSLGDMDRALYDGVYRTLSSFCHSEITNIHHFISDEGFDYLNPDFSLDAMMTCHLLSVVFFSCLRAYSPCSKYLKRDLFVNVERSLLSVCLIDRFLTETTGRGLPSIYRTTISHVIESDPLLRRAYDSTTSS